MEVYTDSLELIKQARKDLLKSKESKQENIFLSGEGGFRSMDEAVHTHHRSYNLANPPQESFDLESLRQEMRERYSNQLLREQEIEQILLSSSDDQTEEKLQRGLATETQPDSVFPQKEESRGLTYYFLCCFCRFCNGEDD